MVNKTSTPELVAALKLALQDEDFIDALAGRVAEKIAEQGLGTAPDPVEAWRRALRSAGVQCADEVTPERAAELYPLEADEIRRLIDRARSEKADKPLKLADLRNLSIQLLGDDALMRRAADQQAAAAPSGQRRRPKPCSGEYECGQPFHCGHEVNCGTTYELLPCGNLYEYACGPTKSCAKPYMCGIRYQR